MSQISGLTYRDLDEALRRVGFLKKEGEQSRLYYQTESEAFIALPIRPMNEAVTALHLVTAVKEVGNFGLMDERDFEMLLVRIAGETVPALAK